jgi:nucleotide-binding universal stress UspA family protein
MGKRRRAFEPGHLAKILVVIDETPECDRAVRFAARRARRNGVGVIMVSIIVPEEGQPWLGVGDLMQAEAEENARNRLDQAEKIVQETTGIRPESVLRTGAKAEQVMKLIDQDEDIATLVLAAGTGKEGPGPLVSLFVGRNAANFPIPVTIVPGGLEDADFEALA